MSELEYDVLDELYFVQSFKALMQLTDLDEKELRAILKMLVDKGWVRCFMDVNDEVMPDKVDFELMYREYYYLASKAGLLAHNGR